VEQIPQDQWQKKGGVPKADYQECLRLSRSLVEPSVHKPVELNDREVLTISYFYDRATDHGLIGSTFTPHFIIYLGFYSDTFKADSTDGGALTIKDFFKAAEEGNC